MAKIRLAAFADEAADDLNGQIAALQKNNIALIELRSVDKINVAQFSTAQAAEIAARLSDAGIAVWSLGAPLGKTPADSPLEKDRETLLRLLDIAHATGADKIRMFSYYTTDPTGDRARIIDKLSALALEATRAGVQLCHENEKDIYGDTVARVCDLLSSVPALQAVFDPANFVQCGQDLRVAMDALLPVARYVHVKDALPDGRNVPAGTGEGQLPALVARLTGEMTCTLEPHLALFGGFSALERGEEKQFLYDSPAAAFDIAVAAFKEILTAQGYREEGAVWIG